MINLLAYDRKAELRAARANVILLRYIGIILLAFLFIGGSLLLSRTLLQSTMHSAEELITSNDTKASVYAATKEQVDSLGKQLGQASTLLNQETKYSVLLPSIAQLMPEGTILSELNLGSANFSGTPVEVKAYSKSLAEASALQRQFQSSALFSRVNLQSTSETGGIKNYPVVVTMSLSLNRTGAR